MGWFLTPFMALTIRRPLLPLRLPCCCGTTVPNFTGVQITHCISSYINQAVLIGAGRRLASPNLCAATIQGKATSLAMRTVNHLDPRPLRVPIAKGQRSRAKILVLARAKGNGPVKAKGQGHAMANGQGSAKARGQMPVRAKGNGHVRTEDNGHVKTMSFGPTKMKSWKRVGFAEAKDHGPIQIRRQEPVPVQIHKLHEMLQKHETRQGGYQMFFRKCKVLFGTRVQPDKHHHFHNDLNFQSRRKVV